MIENTQDHRSPPAGIRTLRDDTLVVLPLGHPHRRRSGLDIFESPQELAARFGELSAYAGSVELVLASDFFDFLQIGEAPDGENRASTTISRPE